jgi:hypothetical protein
MENYGIAFLSSEAGQSKDGPYLARLAVADAVTEVEPCGRLPPSLDLTPFQEPLAWSFFVASYTWAHTWHRWLTLPSSNATHARIRSNCSLALVYGFYGAAHGHGPLQARGAELYASAVQEAGHELSVGLSKSGPNDLSRLAAFSLSVLSMAFFSVSHQSPHGKREEFSLAL